MIVPMVKVWAFGGSWVMLRHSPKNCAEINYMKPLHLRQAWNTLYLNCRAWWGDLYAQLLWQHWNFRKDWWWAETKTRAIHKSKWRSKWCYRVANYRMSRECAQQDGSNILREVQAVSWGVRAPHHVTWKDMLGYPFTSAPLASNVFESQGP